MFKVRNVAYIGMAVPTAIGLGTNLVGTDDIIRERLRLYRDAGVTTLRVGLQGDSLDAKLADLGHLLDLARETGG